MAGKTAFGVLGVILAILGVIWSIPLSIQGDFSGLFFSGTMVVIGIVLIALAFSD